MKYASFRTLLQFNLHGVELGDGLTLHLPAFLMVLSIVALLIYGTPSLKVQMKSLYCLKAPATILGVLWKAGLTLSIKVCVGTIMKSLYGPDAKRSIEADLGPQLMEFRIECIQYVGFVLLSPLLIRQLKQVHVNSIGAQITLLLAALAFLPPWGFKDVVAAFIPMCDALMIDFDVIWAVVVMMYAIAASMLLPTPKEGDSYFHSCLSVMGTTTSLGVAYAFNQIIVQIAGDAWTEVSFQAVYTVIITGVCLSAHLYLKGKDDMFELQYIKKAIVLHFQTTAFVAAWGWNALISACMARWHPPSDNQWTNLFDQLRCAIFVTLIATVVLFATSRFKAQQSFISTLAGLNVGWCWVNAATVFFTDLDETKRPDLLLVWSLVLGVTLVLPVIVMGFTWLMSIRGQQSEEAESHTKHSFLHPHQLWSHL